MAKNCTKGGSHVFRRLAGGILGTGKCCQRKAGWETPFPRGPPTGGGSKKTAKESTSLSEGSRKTPEQVKGTSTRRFGETPCEAATGKQLEVQERDYAAIGKRRFKKRLGSQKRVRDDG